MEQRDKIRLQDLQNDIKSQIESGFTKNFWISAEISEVKSNNNGHCYLTLIDNENDVVTARAQGIIWSSAYRFLRPYFESTAGSPMTAGMRVLVKAQVQYSPLYGMSLIISDIDPAYTVGEYELEKQKIITRLRAEDMFELNSSLEFPVLPRRIAVISSESAAGYRDFMEHLHGNEYGFAFFTGLFQAPMQGESAAPGIISALESVLADSRDFEVVVILRGGGSAVDLICFNDYELAINIAQYPLPVLTAIGHDHDYHVADMVAYDSVKTPTALADYFVDIYAAEDMRVDSLISRMLIGVSSKYRDADSSLQNYFQKISFLCERAFRERMMFLEALEQRVLRADPQYLLERGYLLLYKDGVKISSVKNLVREDKFEVLLKDGRIEGTVLKILKNKEK